MLSSPAGTSPQLQYLSGPPSPALRLRGCDMSNYSPPPQIWWRALAALSPTGISTSQVKKAHLFGPVYFLTCVPSKKVGGQPPAAAGSVVNLSWWHTSTFIGRVACMMACAAVATRAPLRPMVGRGSAVPTRSSFHKLLYVSIAQSTAPVEGLCSHTSIPPVHTTPHACRLPFRISSPSQGQLPHYCTPSLHTAHTCLQTTPGHAAQHVQRLDR